MLWGNVQRIKQKSSSQLIQADLFKTKQTIHSLYEKIDLVIIYPNTTFQYLFIVGVIYPPIHPSTHPSIYRSIHRSIHPQSIQKTDFVSNVPSLSSFGQYFSLDVFKCTFLDMQRHNPFASGVLITKKIESCILCSKVTAKAKHKICYSKVKLIFQYHLIYTSSHCRTHK